MSVLVAKRTQSHVEYVTTTYNLFELVLKQAKKLPKTVTFYLVQPWINHSRNAYVNTFKANNIYLNKENLDIRTNLNKQALEELSGFIALSNVIQDLYYENISATIWLQIGQLVDKAISLIKSIIASDKKRCASE